MMTIILVLLVLGLYWKFYGRQAKKLIRKVTDIFVMQYVMRQIKGRAYWEEGLAEQEIMNFHKRFWGTYGYKNPVLFKNTHDNVWIIEF